MEKFETLNGVAAPLNIVNIDTDMIIPKQFLETIKRTGLGKSLFYEMRYAQDGKEQPDFILNKQAFRKHCLLNGLDDIALSLEKVSSIDAFEKKQANAQPWL